MNSGDQRNVTRPATAASDRCPICSTSNAAIIVLNAILRSLLNIGDMSPTIDVKTFRLKFKKTLKNVKKRDKNKKKRL